MIKVPKLKLPLWQELIYLVFVAVAPIVITCLELFQSHSTAFKISFASVGAVLITYSTIKKYVLANYINKLKQKIVLLEHDYSTANGNPSYIKQQWKTYNCIIYLLQVTQVALVMIVAYMFIMALVGQLIAFKGAATLIVSSIVIAMIFKAICYLSLKVGDTNAEESN